MTTESTTPEPAWFLSLQREATGSRVENTAFCPETGLLALGIYRKEKRWLGFGIGPRLKGIGLLPFSPKFRAANSFHVVAAFRSHLHEQTIRGVTFDPTTQTLWFTFGQSPNFSRLSITITKRGELQLLSANGDVIVRYPQQSPEPEPQQNVVLDSNANLETLGNSLVRSSDRWVLERIKTDLVRSVKRRVEMLERRGQAVKKDLERLQDVGKLQKIGRLLLAQGNAIPKGASSAVLTDWEDNGEITVQLDPSKPAKSQAETYFNRARRLQRGTSVMEQRLAEVETALSKVSELYEALKQAKEIPDDFSAYVQWLEQCKQQAVALGCASVSVQPANNTKNVREEPRRPYHIYRGSGDKVIFVGRGGKDNDALTTQFARPHDLWLHVKGIKGAHVVVPIEKGKTCPSELLVDAATLAAYHSDSRGEGITEVTYVERRYVRKPKGSAPGAVTYTHEKVLNLRLEDDRLTRLLATKQES